MAVKPFWSTAQSLMPRRGERAPMRRPLVLSVLALLLAMPLAGCLGEGGDPSGAPLASDESAAEPARGADWSFVATDGHTYSRDEPPRNATLLFFMATWCSTCRGMGPAVARVNESYADEGLRVFSVSVDATSREEESLDDYEWKASADQDWPHGIDRGQTMMRTFGVFQQSNVVVLDGEGHVVRQWGFGRATEEEMRAAVEDALGRAERPNGAAA